MFRWAVLVLVIPEVQARDDSGIIRVLSKHPQADPLPSPFSRSPVYYSLTLLSDTIIRATVSVFKLVINEQKIKK